MSVNLPSIYLNKLKELFSPKSHTHSVSDISGLSTGIGSIYIKEYGTGFKNYNNVTERIFNYAGRTTVTYDVHYLILSNNLKICWGWFKSHNGSAADELYFPVTFSDTNYWFFGTGTNVDSTSNIGLSTENITYGSADWSAEYNACKETDKIVVNVGVYAHGPFAWMAIGM